MARLRAQQAARQQVDGLQKIAAARSPHDLVDAQTALLREEMRIFLDSASRISAISSKAVRAAADLVREDGDDGSDQPDHPQRRRA
ncbi:phasin family protein [Azospirillum sp. sgz301742]